MTYTTYQAAKIANPDQEIYELCGEFQTGDTPARPGDKWELCNPADHCMTVKQFEDSGKKLADGDLYINLGGNVIQYTEGYGLGVDRNPLMNEGRFILKAKALEETKTYRYKKVTDSIFALKAEFERGELYFAWLGNHEPGSNSVGYDQITDEKMLICRYEEKRLLRRIEVTERELAIEHAAKIMYDADQSSGQINDLTLGALFDAGMLKLVNGRG